MIQPTSPAQALYEIIQAVDERIGTNNNPSAYHAWAAVSGLDHGSSDFVRYHSEVMELLSEVAEEIRTLSSAQQRRYASYLPQWWEALVKPRADWATQGQKIIATDSLQMLGALADVCEMRATASGPRNADSGDMLHRAVTYLVAHVQEASDIPLPVRRQIEADLEHVLWLLSNVNIFGLDHAVAAVEKVTGKVVAETAKSPGAGLKRIAIGLAAALAIAASASTSAAEITSSVREVFGITAQEDGDDRGGDIVQTTVTQIYNTCNVPALPPGTAATDAEDEDDTVDAEIVEE